MCVPFHRKLRVWSNVSQSCLKMVCPMGHIFSLTFSFGQITIFLSIVLFCYLLLLHLLRWIRRIFILFTLILNLPFFTFCSKTLYCQDQFYKLSPLFHLCQSDSHIAPTCTAPSQSVWLSHFQSWPLFPLHFQHMGCLHFEWPSHNAQSVPPELDITQ